MILQSELELKAQLMTSAEADFTAKTWTFRAPSFEVGAGDYLIISLREWRELWDKYSTVGKDGKHGS